MLQNPALSGYQLNVVYKNLILFYRSKLKLNKPYVVPIEPGIGFVEQCQWYAQRLQGIECHYHRRPAWSSGDAGFTPIDTVIGARGSMGVRSIDLGVSYGRAATRDILETNLELR